MPLQLDKTQQAPRSSTVTVHYRVRIINPQNKREYMDLTWHKVTEKFDASYTAQAKVD